MDTPNPYTLLPDLLAELPEIPQDGILSRTVFKGEKAKLVLFAFDTGQELSEHTSSHTAILHILQGEAQVTLGADDHPAQPHTWIYMPPHLPHRILAKTPLIMLLMMLEL